MELIFRGLHLRPWAKKSREILGSLAGISTERARVSLHHVTVLRNDSWDIIDFYATSSPRSGMLLWSSGRYLCKTGTGRLDSRSFLRTFAISRFEAERPRLSLRCFLFCLLKTGEMGVFRFVVLRLQ